MMADRIPALSGRDVVRALERAGFVVVRVSSSHHILRHEGPPVRIVTVPVHGSTSLKRGTLAAIIRQCGMSPESFTALIR
jgi:predicted RNA binding protein YcfA (HicA-like mRNA interferase family)